MKIILKYLKNWKRRIVSSIAFYPILISFLFFLLAVLSIYAESNSLVKNFKSSFSFLIIEDKETSRSILSTLIGSILSLTVFSFSMVMVVLNQASANYSPRLLPGLISDKKNQLILGFYIGTLTYCMMILISLGAYGVKLNDFGLSTIIAALLGIVCVAFFVYFIHSISFTIQINTIIKTLFEKSDRGLDRELKNQTSENVLNVIHYFSESQVITAHKTGYYNGFDSSFINSEFAEQDTIIELLLHNNQRVWKGQPLAKLRDKVSEAETKNLEIAFSIVDERLYNNHSISNMVKLMEIAVRALSPGVNDPGTAMDVIGYLGILLAKTLKLEDTYCINPKGNLKLIINNVPFEELIRKVIQPIRLYAKADSAVMYELICTIKQLEIIAMDVNARHQSILSKELKNIETDIKAHITNTDDLSRLLELI